ncbi:nurim homolog [Diachasma alloeum]|uniref:nurim homolog n=1 Tax=Diachasma alloeum TaxID=454923 RepID=UPI000738108D|nr:nurim homolog [Diachasma alloeum]
MIVIHFGYLGELFANMGSSVVGLLTSSISFFFTFHVLYNFMYFTSSQSYDKSIIVKKSAADDDVYLTSLWKLTINTSLLSVFMLQHSFMASQTVKQFYEKLRIVELERSVYNAASAAALHLIMTNWELISSISLWHIDTSASNKLWLIFSGFHLLAWFVIYSGCVMLDISELTGLKQVWYKMSNRPCPMSTKSREYQRYLLHMRHPSFTAFLIILWVHPLMTIDRFLMASIITVYMLIMWTIDETDYHYHAMNVDRKRRELS